MSATEDSEESELMIKPERENSENVLEIGEYEAIRKRSIYGPKGFGKIVRVNVSGSLKNIFLFFFDYYFMNKKLSKNGLERLISGMEYKTWSSTLDKFPDTLLGNAKTRKYFFHDE